jgi:CheY-like chemotaxis protein
VVEGTHNMASALRAVREGSVTAILVAGEQPGMDALEFVLNARDIDADVPIMVATGTGDAHVDEALVTVGGAVPVTDCKEPERLAIEIQRLLGRLHDEG